MMTEEHCQKLSAHVHRYLCEHFSGYALVAFTAGTEELFVTHQVQDPKTAIALNAALHSIAVLPPHPPEEGFKKET